MSLRGALLLLFGTLLSLFAGALFVAYQISVIDVELAQAVTRRHESYKLADELRQSSDDLTRMARNYVVTGDERFEEYFQRILAIREGDAPRPVEYNRIYWDHVVATGQVPRAGEKAVSLESLMHRQNFTADEFNKLEQAKVRSDALAVLERRAMNAMKGLFSDSEGEFTVKGEIDPELARSILHGDDYFEAKAAIMVPIEEFFGLIEERTEQEVERLRTANRRLAQVAAALTVLGLAIVLVAVIVLRRKVLVSAAGEEAGGARGLHRSSLMTRWPILAATRSRRIEVAGCLPSG